MLFIFCLFKLIKTEHKYLNLKKTTFAIYCILYINEYTLILLFGRYHFNIFIKHHEAEYLLYYSIPASH